MKTKITLTTFTPGEAERIAGISTALQRDWRRRGFLPTNDGHARFDAFVIAQLWIMKLLSDRGIGLVEAKGIGSWCSLGLLWWALEEQAAYEGDHLRVLEWYPDVFARISKNKDKDLARPTIDPNWRTTLSTDDQVKLEQDLSEFYVASWYAQADWLRKQIIQQSGHPRVIPARFFIWWADGKERWVDSLDAAFAAAPDSAVQGPVLTLDLQSMARALLDKAARPLAHIEIESQ